MQTFLVDPSYNRSAMMLDQRRLGKQRVENLQIMIALLEGRGFIHHPAVKMWQHCEWSLLQYQEAICNEWMFRGFADSCLNKTTTLFFKHRTPDQGLTPWWLGNPELHISHQSNLIRKDPAYYRPRFPDVPDDLPYYWPV